MPSEIRWRSVLSLPRRSLRVKIIAWFFVPTAIILVAVALVTFFSYQQVTEDLVIERDQDVTRLSAGQLVTELTEYTNILADIARTTASSQNDPTAQQDSLGRASRQSVVFDSGVFVLDTFGTVVAAEPQRPEILGQDWSDRSYFRQMLRFPEPTFSNILTDGSQEAEVIVVAVPVIGDQDEFLGSAVGMFRLSPTAASAFYGGIVKLRIGGSGSTYLVDGNGRVIYHSDTDRIGADFSSQPVVRQVLAGQVSAIRTRDFDGGNIVAGFAPVTGTPWGLVTEESWSALTSASRGYQRFLILLLALGVAVPVLFVVIGLRRIMRPVESLIVGAREVAGGNFSQTIPATSGDEIEELAREFNSMAGALKESYTDLEMKVATRTEELSESEERYRALFEQSRDAIFISSGGKVVAANEAALDLFGFTREEAIGSDVGDRYADPSERGRFRQAMERDGSISEFEVRLLKQDGTTMDCLLTASMRPVENRTDAREIQGVVRDITERKRAEEALQEAEEKYRSIFENAVEGIFHTLPEGRYLSINPALARIYGYESPKELMATLIDIEHQLYVEPGRFVEVARLLREHGAVSGFESQVYRKDGSVIWISVTARAVQDESGTLRYYEGTVEDVTERKLAEEQGRELAVLEERNRMAREIHDTLAQGFTGIVLQLEAAEQVLDDSPAEVPNHLSRAKGLARESLQEARRSVWNLIPQALEQRALEVVLQEEVGRFDTTGQKEAHFSLSGDRLELPPVVQAALLRICQESLTNIRKHAKATEVRVDLTFYPEAVYLGVRDNGIGFNIEELEAIDGHSGFGLTGMEQRTHLLGGTLDVRSRKGTGTLIEVRIPTTRICQER